MNDFLVDNKERYRLLNRSYILYVLVLFSIKDKSYYFKGKN